MSISEIRNPILRRSLLAIAVPPLMAFSVLCGALIAACESVDAIIIAWRGPDNG